MRILAASAVLITVVLLSGCATTQKYPAFSAMPGGRLVLFDRQGANNLLPARESPSLNKPDPIPPNQPVR